LQTDIDLGISS